MLNNGRVINFPPNDIFAFPEEIGSAVMIFVVFFSFGRRLLASITLKWVVNGSLIFSSCYLALIVSQRENDNWGAGRHKVLKRSKEEQLTQPPARSLHKVEVITSKQNNSGGVFTLMCVCVQYPKLVVISCSNSGRHGATWKPSVVVSSLNFEIFKFSKIEGNVQN